MKLPKQDLEIYGLSNCPESYLHLLYTRVHGSIASQLLNDESFESKIPNELRIRSAMSLESIIINNYILKDLDGKNEINPKIVLFLDSQRPANPCLCLSFDVKEDKSSEPRILSLLLYNEFQMPLGLYDHQDGVFIVYSHGNQQEVLNFFDAQFGYQLIQDLRQYENEYNYAEIVKRKPLGRIVATGFNKSFGHAHWNDLLGSLYLRDSKIIDRAIQYDIIVGPKSWLNPNDIIEKKLIVANSTKKCSDYIISHQLLVHIPLGFRIDSRFVKFWKQEITANLNSSTATLLNKLKEKCSPIIAFNLRYEEWWRYGWANQQEQVIRIIDSLIGEYPNLGIVIDGMTSFWSEENIKNPTTNSIKFESIIQYLSCKNIPFCNLDMMHISEKVCAYQIVDYTIGQFGSGEIMSTLVHSNNSLTICGNVELIEPYSHPKTISRLCKDQISNNPNVAKMLPGEFITVSSAGFVIKYPEGLNFILNQIKTCLAT